MFPHFDAKVRACKVMGLVMSTFKQVETLRALQASGALTREELARARAAVLDDVPEAELVELADAGKTARISPAPPRRAHASEGTDRARRPMDRPAKEKAPTIGQAVLGCVFFSCALGALSALLFGCNLSGAATVSIATLGGVTLALHKGLDALIDPPDTER